MIGRLFAGVPRRGVALLAALLVALALLLPRLDYAWPWGLVTWIIVVGFFVLLFLAVRLAWSVFRSGRSKF